MKTFEEFKKKLGYMESGGRYEIENEYGFLGKYQFGKPRLLDLGISIDNYGKFTHPLLYKKAKKITKKEFLNNPELQEEVFRAHVNDLKEIILKRYGHYLGKKINGVKITLSGAIAGAHLVGLGGLLKWLKTGKEVKDAYNTSVSTYVSLLGDYEV